MWTIGAQVSSGLFSSQNGLGLNGHGSVRDLDDGHFAYFDLTKGIWLHSVDHQGSGILYIHRRVSFPLCHPCYRLSGILG